MNDAPSDSVGRVIDRVRSHDAALREHVRQGRLHQIETELDARSEALGELVELLGPQSGSRSPHVQGALDRLRDEGHALIEWMRNEKQDVGRALGSMRARRVDPYGEGEQGPVVLDRHR